MRDVFKFGHCYGNNKYIPQFSDGKQDRETAVSVSNVQDNELARCQGHQTGCYGIHTTYRVQGDACWHP